MKGLIFSIEEFALYDGPGVRINVFFKGCPLRCKWCHNPEGWKVEREIVKNPNGCLHCGECLRVCPSHEKCIGCRQCIINCPRGLIRFSGTEWEAQALAEKILGFSSILKDCGGGVTFSGGEVLMQCDFLCELLDATKTMNRAIETSGFGDIDKFKEVLKRVELVYFDLKIMDSLKHEQYTGVSNDLILKNSRILMNSNVPFIIRVPYIHDINTDEQNLIMLSEFIKHADNLEKIELLSYNMMAGAKYKMLGLTYHNFEKPTKDDFERAEKIFCAYNIPYVISY